MMMLFKCNSVWIFSKIHLRYRNGGTVEWLHVFSRTFKFSSGTLQSFWLWMVWTATQFSSLHFKHLSTFFLDLVISNSSKESRKLFMVILNWNTSLKTLYTFFFNLARNAKYYDHDIKYFDSRLKMCVL